MATPTGVTWDCEPHTRAKHEILKRYLQRWFPILNAYHGRIIYIDGFSGPGRYTGGELGSPLLALDVASTHRRTLSGDIRFLFTDERADRIEHLRSELTQKQYPTHFKITADTVRFHEKLTQILDEVDASGGKLAPTFAFIDPFGFSGIPYSLMKRFLEKKSCEVLITFMVDSINRWLEHPNDEVVKHIPETFGTDDCLKIAKSGGDRIAALQTLYREQLHRVAEFVRYFEMRDSDHRIIYYLFFASNHPLGHVKMKEAMFDVGDAGLYTFSDATDPSQQVLFGTDHAATLWPLLRSQFAGREVLTDVILEFVNDKTAFLATHMKATLKNHLAESVEPRQRIQVRPMKANGKKWIKGTFPEGVYVTFPT